MAPCLRLDFRGEGDRERLSARKRGTEKKTAIARKRGGKAQMVCLFAIQPIQLPSNLHPTHQLPSNPFQLPTNSSTSISPSTSIQPIKTIQPIQPINFHPTHPTPSNPSNPIQPINFHLTHQTR